MPIFDGYLMVDWSANSTPKAGDDSIWAAWGLNGDSQPIRTANLPTRNRARSFVDALLANAVSRELRVLIGFDFAYSYPKGFARSLKLEEGEGAWRRVWAEIAAVVQDEVTNANGRFEAAAHINARVGNSSFIGPFWACPGKGTDWLRPTKPDFSSLPEAQKISEFRRTDIWLRENRNPTIQSAWKLFTPGSVGSQALLGIPVLHSLVTKFETFSRVWPFQTGFTDSPAATQGPLLVHAEIWPGVLGTVPESTNFVCKDEAQVYALVSVLRQLDRRETLGLLFAPQCVTNPLEPSLVNEEGWILGAGIAKELIAEIRTLALDVFHKYTPPNPIW